MADLAAGRYILTRAPVGTSNSVMAAGGYTTTRVATTEEWTVSATVATVTTS